jgi:hypothetical protein
MTLIGPTEESKRIPCSYCHQIIDHWKCVTDAMAESCPNMEKAKPLIFVTPEEKKVPRYDDIKWQSVLYEAKEADVIPQKILPPELKECSFCFRRAEFVCHVETSAKCCSHYAAHTRRSYGFGEKEPTKKKLSSLETQVGGEHYKNFPIEPIEFCQRNKLGFCESLVIKYICRHKLKGGKEDLLKAIHCLTMLIDLEYSV